MKLMKKEKIIEVLEFLKSYCAKNRTCWNCYLYNQHNECCLLTDDMQFPARWDIENIKENLRDIERI